MYKKFISKISLALLSSLVIIQSCQIPNVSDNKNQVTSSKTQTFKTKAKVTHVEDFSNPYIFGFTYNREVNFKVNSINLFHSGEADPNFYLISENISNTTEQAGGSIRYDKLEKKWIIGLFSHYLDIPEKGGNNTYQNSSGDGRYTEDHNVDVSISENEMTLNLLGKMILNDAYSTGPHGIPTYCEGVDLLIHSGMCYYHYNSIQTDKYKTTVKIPLRTSEINLSIPDKELGCVVKSTDIGVTADNEFEGWTLEISGTEGNLYRNVVEGSGNKVIKFDAETLPVGTYQVKAFYTNHPESAESDTIKVIPSDQCPNECDCSNNLGGFGIKGNTCNYSPCNHRVYDLDSCVNKGTPISIYGIPAVYNFDFKGSDLTFILTLDQEFINSKGNNYNDLPKEYTDIMDKMSDPTKTFEEIKKNVTVTVDGNKLALLNGKGFDKDEQTGFRRYQNPLDKTPIDPSENFNHIISEANKGVKEFYPWADLAAKIPKTQTRITDGSNLYSNFISFSVDLDTIYKKLTNNNIPIPDKDALMKIEIGKGNLKRLIKFKLKLDNKKKQGDKCKWILECQ